jgi:hypothetical protein
LGENGEINNASSSRPDKLSEKIERILSVEKESLTVNAKELRNLFDETVTLAKENYTPYFKL